jgi:hypothetical protein
LLAISAENVAGGCGMTQAHCDGDAALRFGTVDLVELRDALLALGIVVGMSDFAGITVLSIGLNIEFEGVIIS